MSGHCPGCGTYHEQDDDRLCVNCSRPRERNRTNIDALVAEKVMGWPHIDKDTPYRMHKHRGGVIVDGIAQQFSTIGIIPKDFRPSTDPAAMMVVLEEMDRRKFGVHITRVRAISDNTMSWAVDLNQPRDDGAFGQGDHESMPLAVCLASLRACGTTEAEIHAHKLNTVTK